MVTLNTYYIFEYLQREVYFVDFLIGLIFGLLIVMPGVYIDLRYSFDGRDS